MITTITDAALQIGLILEENGIKGIAATAVATQIARDLDKEGRLVAAPKPFDDPQDITVQPHWAKYLPVQQQSVLLLATRGPDGMRKHHPAKDVIRAYRACAMNAAEAGRPLRVSEEGDNFMSAHHLREQLWLPAVRAFFDHVDEIPHHYLLHLLHGAEILGYHHPSDFIAKRWREFYIKGCDDMHLPFESKTEMNARLNDFGRSNGGRQNCLGDDACDMWEHSLRCAQSRRVM